MDVVWIGFAIFAVLLASNFWYRFLTPVKKRNFDLSKYQRITTASITPSINHHDISVRIDSVMQRLLSNQRLLYPRASANQTYLESLRSGIAELNEITLSLQSPQHQNQLPNYTKTPCECTESADLDNITQELQPSLAAVAKSVDATIMWHIESNIMLCAPNHFIKKMLRKLILNALRYGDKGNQIEVNAAVLNNYCVFRLWDTACGISHQQLSSIKSDSQSSHLAGRRFSDVNLPLNLSLIIKTVRGLNGKIEIDSACEIGTRVTIFIPLAKTENINTNANGDIPTDSVQSPVDILYYCGSQAPDQQIILELQSHYRITVLPSIDLVMPMINEVQPKVIVCDGTGVSAEIIEFLKFVSFLPNAPEMGVICITNPMSNADRCQLYATGIQHLLERPITEKEVCIVVENILKQIKNSQLRVAEAIANYTVIQEDEPVFQSKASKFEKAFTGCISECYALPEFSQKDCAEKLFMSQKTLQREIRRHLQSSFRDYLRKHRIDKAKSFIMQGQSVTSAGLNAGFSSPSYFAQCFKREMGYMPSLLSKKLGQD